MSAIVLYWRKSEFRVVYWGGGYCIVAVYVFDGYDMTPEVKVKNQIKDILKNHGVWYTMPIGGAYSTKGTPDFLCCINGRFLAIEAKAGKGKTTALQERELRRIRGAEGVALVVNEENIKDLEEMLELCKS